VSILQTLFRPQVRLRTFVILVAIFALFFAYETTTGPWRQFQHTADGYASRAKESAKRAELEKLEGAKWARLASDIPDGDLTRVATNERALRHQRLAEYFSELALKDSSMERAYRRVSWRPWEDLPPDPLAPDPLRPRVTKVSRGGAVPAAAITNP
jgi:hypothetical protein